MATTLELQISSLEIILRLTLAVLLSGLIGIERERTNWFAGLRTHMLVCVGAALVMIVSQYAFHEVLLEKLIILDPSRVAAQVVSGIGFLGAGTILFWKNTIKGLTTAASLWMVAAIGLAIGGGLYLAGIAATVVSFIVLAGLKPIERMFFKKNKQKEICCIINEKNSLSLLSDTLKQLEIYPYLVNIQLETGDNKEFIKMVFSSLATFNAIKVVDELKKIKSIEKIEINE